MTTIDPKLVERIFKLDAKAKSCRDIGSIPEAEAFAAGVLKLLMQHNLTWDDLEKTREVEIVEAEYWVGGKRSPPEVWEGLLAAVVARAYLCESLYNGEHILLVGRASNIALVEYALDSLFYAVQRLLDNKVRVERAHWSNTFMPPHAVDHMVGPTFREQFLIGFVSGIERSLTVTKQQEAETVPGMALVIASVDQVTKDYVDDVFDAKRTEVVGDTDDPAFRDGYAAGRVTTVTRGVDATSSDTPLQLS